MVAVKVWKGKMMRRMLRRMRTRIRSDTYRRERGWLNSSSLIYLTERGARIQRRVVMGSERRKRRCLRKRHIRRGSC